MQHDPGSGEPDVFRRLPPHTERSRGRSTARRAASQSSSSSSRPSGGSCPPRRRPRCRLSRTRTRRRDPRGRGFDEIWTNRRSRRRSAPDKPVLADDPYLALGRPDSAELPGRQAVGLVDGPRRGAAIFCRRGSDGTDDAVRPDAPGLVRTSNGDPASMSAVVGPTCVVVVGPALTHGPNCVSTAPLELRVRCRAMQTIPSFPRIDDGEVWLAANMVIFHSVAVGPCQPVEWRYSGRGRRSTRRPAARATRPAACTARRTPERR